MGKEDKKLISSETPIQLHFAEEVPTIERDAEVPTIEEVPTIDRGPDVPTME